jgi:F-type H+-transporting ATPase subunit delta
MTDETAYVRAYARALLSAARSAASIPAVQRDLAAVLGALAEAPDLRRWICRKVISSPARRMAEARERLQPLVTPMTLRLLLRMAAWNHLHLLPAVVRRFDDSLRRLEGRRTARIVCAQPPADATLHALRTALSSDGRAVEMDVVTNPDLLAGLTVRIEDRVFDASLAGRLNRLRLALANPGLAATP